MLKKVELAITLARNIRKELCKSCSWEQDLNKPSQAIHTENCLLMKRVIDNAKEITP